MIDNLKAAMINTLKFLDSEEYNKEEYTDKEIKLYNSILAPIMMMLAQYKGVSITQYGHDLGEFIESYMADNVIRFPDK